MPSRSFVGCAKTDCKWNEEGQCSKSDIFIDDAVSCASYEPEMGPMGMLAGLVGMGAPTAGLGPGGPATAPGPDIRSMLVRQMAGGGPAAPTPPPTTAPPPLRF